MSNFSVAINDMCSQLVVLKQDHEALQLDFDSLLDHAHDQENEIGLLKARVAEMEAGISSPKRDLTIEAESVERFIDFMKSYGLLQSRPEMFFYSKYMCALQDRINDNTKEPANEG